MLFTQRSRQVAFGLAASTILGAPVAFAIDHFQAGLQYFQTKDYAHAASYLDAAVKETPWDARVIYYAALAHQYNRDFKTATMLYKHIADKFPGTEACANSIAALKALDPKYGQSAAASSSPAASTSVASSGGDPLTSAQFTAPSECNIPVTRKDGANMVDAIINGHRTSAEFTGEETVMSAKDAVALGLASSSSPPAAGAKLKVSMSVGQVSASGYPITIMQTDHPRLGGDFFSKFAFSLDGNAIHVRKKGAGAANTLNDIPFRKEGKYMIISISCNGRNVQVAFDPDSGENVVPKSRIREFGLDAQEKVIANTRQGWAMNGGQGQMPVPGDPGYGNISTKTTAQAKIVCGPAVTPEVNFRCDDDVKQAKVGSGIFGSWKYDIDQSAKVIHLHR